MTFTENGAIAHGGTGNLCLNFFTRVMAHDKATAMTDENIVKHIKSSWRESPSTTLRLLAHLRDVRGGKGERHAATVCWKWLVQNHPVQARANMQHVSFFGRWKDMLDIFVGTALETDMFQLYVAQLLEDFEHLNKGKSTDDPIERCQHFGQVSLAAKWAPTEGCKEDKDAKKVDRVPPSYTMAMMLYHQCPSSPAGLSDSALMRWYRKTFLTPLREVLDLVESHLCKHEFDQIDFSKVPGVALKMYSRKTFPKHAAERFAQWQRDVLAGKAKINSGTVDPYEVVHLLVNNTATEEQKPTLEAYYCDQLAKLRGKNCRALVVADVSGSMVGTPMEVSVAMAIWISAMAAPPWRDIFFTFDSRPAIISLAGCSTLEERVRVTLRAPWGGSTDLQATLDLILTRATESSLPPDQMPTRLIIVSDMQFNQACSAGSAGSAGSNIFTNLEVMRAKFRAAGYEMPVVVFWNVRGNTKSDAAPATADDRGVVMLSGFSKNMIASVLEDTAIPTPYDQMLKVLSDPRYDRMRLEIGI